MLGFNTVRDPFTGLHFSLGENSPFLFNALQAFKTALVALKGLLHPLHSFAGLQLVLGQGPAFLPHALQGLEADPFPFQGIL